MRRFMFLGLMLVLVVGCSGESNSDQAETGLSQRQRDSLVAESDLPGAAAVGKALSISDSAAARAARLDSLTR